MDLSTVQFAMACIGMFLSGVAATLGIVFLVVSSAMQDTDVLDTIGRD